MQTVRGGWNWASPALIANAVTLAKESYRVHWNWKDFSHWFCNLVHFPVQVSSVWCIVTFVFDKCCSHPLKELSFSKYVVAVVFVGVVLSSAITFKGTSSPSQNMFCKKTPLILKELTCSKHVLYNTFNFKGTNFSKQVLCGWQDSKTKNYIMPVLLWIFKSFYFAAHSA